MNVQTEMIPKGGAQLQLFSFFTRSLRSRLVLYFTLLMMVPLSVAGYMIYKVSDARISDGALRLVMQIVEKDSESVDEVLSDMQTAAHMVTVDNTIQNILHQQAPDEDDLRTQRLSDRLKQISNMYEGLNGIYIWLDDGTIAKSRYYSVREAPFLDGETYLSIRNHADSRWFASDEGSLITDNLNDAVLSLAVSLPLRDGGAPCGIVIVEVKQSYLGKLMSADFGRRGTIILVDIEDGIVLQGISADEAVVQEAVAQTRQTAVGLRMETADLKDRLLLFDRLPSTGWVMTGVVFKNELKDDSQPILLVFVTAMMVAFLLNLIISRYLANYEFKPIRRIQEYVLQVEQGNFGQPLPPERGDEIGKLASSVQEMSEKIGHLVETLKTEQERMRTAEFKALQAQINPHFLYNSLDSINWLARRGDVQKTTEMVTALTTFFRIGLSKGKDLITVREEVEHVRSYLVIQKIRYESQFDYSFYVDPETEQYFVPKLILQPLVENALYHGIKLCDRKCLLMIQVLARENEIEIEVLDNGAGMDEETLQSVREAMEHTGENRTNSYGVVNVNDRIRILAGPQYGLVFTSEKGVGTSAKIVLPKTLKGA